MIPLSSNVSSNDRSLSLLDTDATTGPDISAVDLLEGLQHNLYICKIDNILQSDRFLNHVLYVITYDFFSSEVHFSTTAVSSAVESFSF